SARSTRPRYSTTLRIAPAMNSPLGPFENYNLRLLQEWSLLAYHAPDRPACRTINTNLAPITPASPPRRSDPNARPAAGTRTGVRLRLCTCRRRYLLPARRPRVADARHRHRCRLRTCPSAWSYGYRSHDALRHRPYRRAAHNTHRTPAVRSRLEWLERRVVAARLRHYSPRRTAVRSVRRSEEHTSELQSRFDLVCRLLLEKNKETKYHK